MALELRISTISLDPRDGCAVLILEHASTQRIFPLWLSDEDAASVVAAVDRVPATAGASHDLMMGIIRGLGGEVAWVELEGVVDGVVRASVGLEHTDEPVVLPASAADAIALATRARAPILIDELFLERVAEAVADAEARVSAQRRDETSDVAPLTQAERWNQLIHHLAIQGSSASTPEA